MGGREPDSVTPPGTIVRWGLVFLGAAAVRLAYWAFVTPHWVPDADADQYVHLSRSLAAGRGFGLVFPQLAHHPTAFRPPLYPLLLTPGSWLFDGALWPGRLLNVVLGSLVAVLAGVLAARIAGRRAGLVAGAVVAIYPPLVANDTITLTEPLALALLLGAVLAVDARRWALAGGAVGLLLLTRPNGYLVVLVLAAYAWAHIGPRAALGLAAIAVAILVPWLVRNHIQLGTWSATTSDGFTLAAVYGEPAQQAGGFVDPAFSPAYDDTTHRLARFDEAAWNRLLQREAIDAVRANPGYVGQVARRNVRGYFDLDPGLNRWPERNDGRRWGFRQAALPIYAAVTVAGLVGLARCRRDPRVIVVLVLVAQYVALSLLLVAPPRLRAPFDLACCVGAGLLAGRARSGTQEPSS